MTRAILAIAVGLVVVDALAAQEAPAAFRWQKGQTLTYKTQHVTAVEEFAEGSTVKSSSKVSIVKRWLVADVDAKGAATVQMSLVSLRNEQTRPNGEVLLFDSTMPDKGTPELREQMSKYVGQTVAILRVDTQGRILEVKQGPANKYEAEPPFAIVFPAVPLKEGLAWLRPFTVTLDPPFGTGQKYEATQKYACTKIVAGKATFTTANQFKSLPEATKDQVPLLQKMIEGQIVFDLQVGRLTEVQLNIDRTLTNHQGENSKYQFQSQYVEQLVDVK